MGVTMIDFLFGKVHKLQNMQSLALLGMTYIVEGLVSEADSFQPSIDIRV